MRISTIYDAWTRQHGGPNRWNGQMDVPSRREIPILWNEAFHGTPTVESREDCPTPKWTDGMALIWQLPILQR